MPGICFDLLVDVSVSLWAFRKLKERMIFIFCYSPVINCHVYDSKILLHFKKLAFRPFSSIKRTFNSELNIGLKNKLGNS